MKGYTWTGEESVVETKCLAERNRGLYLTAETQDELMQALEKTLEVKDAGRKLRSSCRGTRTESDVDIRQVRFQLALQHSPGGRA